MVPVLTTTTTATATGVPLSAGGLRLTPAWPPGGRLPTVGTAGGRLLADVVTMTPNAGDLPGGDVLQKLMNGLDGWALALALVGLVVGAAAWALGSHGQNYQQSFVGRRAVLISGLAALLIGAGPGIVNFFFNAGTGVHSP
jgi:hypothetical protein